jgi:hypothetical protein
MDILCNNEKLIEDFKKKMLEIAKISREMESLDFDPVKNFKRKEILDYMIKYNTWITKNNFREGQDRIRSFDRCATLARK